MFLAIEIEPAFLSDSVGFMSLISGALAKPLATLLFLVLAAVVSGCIGPAEESAWRWKQANPEYRAPYHEEGKAFRPGIF